MQDGLGCLFQVGYEYSEASYSCDANWRMEFNASPFLTGCIGGGRRL